jgi:hypothetical protein
MEGKKESAIHNKTRTLARADSLEHELPARHEKPGARPG